MLQGLTLRVYGLIFRVSRVWAFRFCALGFQVKGLGGWNYFRINDEEVHGSEGVNLGVRGRDGGRRFAMLDLLLAYGKLSALWSPSR